MVTVGRTADADDGAAHGLEQRRAEEREPVGGVLLRADGEADPAEPRGLLDVLERPGVRLRRPRDQHDPAVHDADAPDGQPAADGALTARWDHPVRQPDRQRRVEPRRRVVGGAYGDPRDPAHRRPRQVVAGVVPAVPGRRRRRDGHPQPAVLAGDRLGHRDELVGALRLGLERHGEPRPAALPVDEQHAGDVGRAARGDGGLHGADGQRGRRGFGRVGGPAVSAGTAPRRPPSRRARPPWPRAVAVWSSCRTSWSVRAPDGARQPLQRVGGPLRYIGSDTWARAMAAVRWQP